MTVVGCVKSSSDEFPVVQWYFDSLTVRNKSFLVNVNSPEKKHTMSRSKAKPRRTPDPPVSYLDGVPMKLSDAFRRPPRVALPFNVVVNDLDNVLRELDYDFSLEESVVRNAEEQRRVWEEAEKKRERSGWLNSITYLLQNDMPILAPITI